MLARQPCFSNQDYCHYLYAISRLEAEHEVLSARVIQADQYPLWLYSDIPMSQHDAAAAGYGCSPPRAFTGKFIITTCGGDMADYLLLK